jgi:CheY-like chemotaxis protein
MHRVLIIEDDPSTAYDLAELTRALDCEPVIVDNKYDAIRKLSEVAICFVLLDLEIKVEPDAIRGTLIAGTTLLKRIRELHPYRSGKGHRLPVLVVSGHTQEAEVAVEVMREGADDVLQKPIINQRLVSDRIQQCLVRSERADHAACIALPARASPGPNMVEISIPGDRNKRRTRVLVRGVSLAFTDAPLRNLLYLIAGKLSNERTHKRDLGADDHGFKAISTLRKELANALGELEIIKNDGEGHYWLSDEVRIGACNVDGLMGLGDHKIDEIADKIRGLTRVSSR